MKVITHGNCLQYVCPECNCIFQATCAEKGTEYRGGMACISTPSEAGYYRECPECGYDSVKGKAKWRADDAEH